MGCPSAGSSVVVPEEGSDTEDSGSLVGGAEDSGALEAGVLEDGALLEDGVMTPGSLLTSVPGP